MGRIDAWIEMSGMESAMLQTRRLHGWKAWSSAIYACAKRRRCGVGLAKAAKQECACLEGSVEA